MRILLVGTLDGQIGAASQIAMAQGAEVSQAGDIDSALKVLRSGQSIELVMIDVNLEVGSLIEHLRAERMAVTVVACGVDNDTHAAVRAIRAGAKEYVPLPPDAELIAAVLKAIAEDKPSIIFEDPLMARVFKLADQVAASSASILVAGESGTGKEVLARYLHQNSPRSKARFVAVNCAAIPENLLESELFGHEKGAFTGAVAKRIGRFEEADGGTLLLDEISEMDIRLQAKLLRAIQEGEIDRVGGSKPVKVNVRIIATSNRNLEAEVARKAFRQDLYFRLNVVTIEIPPLRKRPGDILVLADHFLAKYAETNGVSTVTLSADARQVLVNHSWPGNVRELENAMQRTVLLATGDEISSDALHLPSALGMGGDVEPIADDDGERLIGRTVAEVERELIIDTLSHCLGNRTHAANILGISIRTLRNKLRQYNEQGFTVPLPGEGERTAL